jgi:Zn-dependent protease with chaperone function
MALATDTRAPATMVFEGPCLNAAVIGDCPEGAGIMISRTLLNSLDADEKQGVLAHLMAVVINGDLHLTGALLRVCYMTGLALTLLDLPFSPQARRTIGLLWRYARQTGQESTTPNGDDIGAALTRAAQPDGLESLVIVVRKLIGEETDLRSILSIVLLLPLLPVLVLRLAAGLLYGLLSIWVLSPLSSLVLRPRRILADTTAAKLTHRPDALGRALIHLEDAPHRLTEAGWSEMNFMLGQDSSTRRVFDGVRARIAEAITTANNFNHRLRSATTAVANPLASDHPDPASARHNFVFGFHPPLGLRIVELNKQGAEIAWSAERDYSSWSIAGVVAAFVGVVLLILFA